MIKNLSFIALSLLVLSCNKKQTQPINADQIIAEAINVAGVKKLDHAVLAFDFRDKHYEAGRYAGNYVLKRQFKDSINTIVDYLSNQSFERRVNDSLVTVPDSMATKYSASVNSVHYFAVLPYGLDGKAVNKTYLDSVKLKGKMYHKIKVTFDEDGGGEDFEDEFIFWVDTQTKKIDYLAYSYNEEDGKGMRFREAYNERYINGVRFVDFNNYKPKENTTDLEQLDSKFENNQLELLSKIELENVTVN